jgi:apolipoprotein N-acyltransferase
MIMRLRQPNRRGFRSPIRERRKRQREYYYAAVSVLVVKIVLSIFLVVLFWVSFRLFHYGFPHLAPVVRYALPTIIAVFTVVLACFIYKNIKDIKELHREKRTK